MSRLSSSRNNSQYPSSNNSPPILDLLDEGWFASGISPRDAIKRRAIENHANQNNNNTIPPALDLATLTNRQWQAGMNSPDITTRSIYSAWESPRSCVTIASVSSLPQTDAELDNMNIEEIAQLAEEADVLYKRAALARRLARDRLLQSTHSINALSLSDVVVRLYGIALTCVYIFFILVYCVFSAVSSLFFSLLFSRGQESYQKKRENDIQLPIFLNRLYYVIGACSGALEAMCRADVF